MIDERKLIEELNRIESIVNFYRDDTRQVCLNMICEIKDFVNEQPKVGEWISVKDKLPKVFELVELLKKHDLENLSIKELDKWFDRSLWHVNKVNELSNQLVEYQRVAKQKQERIEELEKQKTKVIANININREELEKIVNENIHKLLDNTPLKFEELKPNMWVFDNKYKEYCYIYFIAGKYPHRKYIDNCESDSEFEENRFYRYEVK